MGDFIFLLKNKKISFLCKLTLQAFIILHPKNAELDF